jgi:hypothetical protein
MSQISPITEALADIRTWQSKKAGLDGFNAHMRFVGDMARQAERLNVHSHQKALAVMVGKLTGLTLTRIVGEADANDATLLADDLRDVAKIVDAFVAEIGSYAGSNFNRIDEKLFANVLSDAIDGNALYELETAGERRTADLAAE